MDRFWDEFSKSTIVSGLLALMVWGTIGALAIMGREMPDILIWGGSGIIGFFFGAKTQAQTTRAQVQILESAAPIQDCDCDLID